MKTIANIAIIGLASALRIREEAEDLEADYCAEIAQIPDDATWEDISAMIVEKTGEEITEADFDAAVAECFGDFDGEGEGDEGEGEGDDEDADEFEGSGDDDEGEGSGDDDDEVDGSSQGSGPGDDSDDGDADADSTDGEGSMDGSDVEYDDGSSVGSLSSGEGSADSQDGEDGEEEEGEWSDMSDDEAEFLGWCASIAEIPDDATWEDIAAGLEEEMGDDAPTEEEFIAVSWACGAVEHGTDFINDFEDVCWAIVEHVPEGAGYADVVEFLAEELGDDVPTEDEWNAINWACEAAAEWEAAYGDEGDEDDGEEEPAPMEEAQIKDDDLPTPEQMAAHCPDLDHIEAAGVDLEGDWDDILAFIVKEFGDEGAPTEAEFDAVVEFCADDATM